MFSRRKPSALHVKTPVVLQVSEMKTPVIMNKLEDLKAPLKIDNLPKVDEDDFMIGNKYISRRQQAMRRKEANSDIN